MIIDKWGCTTTVAYQISASSSIEEINCISANSINRKQSTKTFEFSPGRAGNIECTIWSRAHGAPAIGRSD